MIIFLRWKCQIRFRAASTCPTIEQAKSGFETLNDFYVTTVRNLKVSKKCVADVKYKIAFQELFQI